MSRIKTDVIPVFNHLKSGDILQYDGSNISSAPMSIDKYGNMTIAGWIKSANKYDSSSVVEDGLYFGKDRKTCITGNHSLTFHVSGNLTYNVGGIYKIGNVSIKNDNIQCNELSANSLTNIERIDNTTKKTIVDSMADALATFDTFSSNVVNLQNNTEFKINDTALKISNDGIFSPAIETSTLSSKLIETASITCDTLIASTMECDLATYRSIGTQSVTTNKLLLGDVEYISNHTLSKIDNVDKNTESTILKIAHKISSFDGKNISASTAVLEQLETHSINAQNIRCPAIVANHLTTQVIQSIDLNIDAKSISWDCPTSIKTLDLESHSLNNNISNIAKSGNLVIGNGSSTAKFAVISELGSIPAPVACVKNVKPQQGLQIYDKDTNTLNISDGERWHTILHGDSIVVTQSKLESVGCLTKGSIDYGFGNIDIRDSTITAKSLFGVKSIDVDTSNTIIKSFTIKSLPDLSSIGTNLNVNGDLSCNTILLGDTLLTPTSLNSNLFSINGIKFKNGIDSPEYRLNGEIIISNKKLGTSIIESSLTSVGDLIKGSIKNGFGPIDVTTITSNDLVCNDIKTKTISLGNMIIKNNIITVPNFIVNANNIQLGPLKIFKNTIDCPQLHLTDKIAIGDNILQGTTSLAIGYGVGDKQTTSCVGLGNKSGNNQAQYSNAIGYNSGNSQAHFSNALGYNSGNNQAQYSISFGYESGNDQNAFSIAIGYGAGKSQGTKSISMGFEAGQSSQDNSIAIGCHAGQFNQGKNALAFGYCAGQTNQHNNTLVLNASGRPLSTDGENRSYIAAVRQDATQNMSLKYNPKTHEIVYSDSQTYSMSHPTDNKRQLIHSYLEGPEIAVYYRGRGEVKTFNTPVVVKLPNYVNNLICDWSVQLTPLFNGGSSGPWEIPRLGTSEVKNGEFVVYATAPCKFHWQAMGKRKDFNSEPLL